MPKISTPWGEADYFVRLDPDKKVLRVSTARSGGIGVHPSIELPPYIKRHAVVDADGWAWFDDCNCDPIIVALPNLFGRPSVEAAKNVLQHSHPETFMAHFGVALTASTSRALERREFEFRTKDQFVPTAGFGDWAWDVPEGHVYVCGWRHCDEAIAGFLVPAERFYRDADRLLLDEFPRWEPNRSLLYRKEHGYLPEHVPARA